MPGYANPQSLNRFSYVTNNPLRYIDPTGHWADEGCGTGGPGGGTGCNLPNPVPPPGGGGGGGGDPKDMKTSEEGLSFIIYWEGEPASIPYNDLGGNCTIGYGHVLDSEECSGAIKKHYNPKFGGKPLSLSGAQDFLAQDIYFAEIVIKKTVTADLTQAQFDALVSYVYNSGGEPGQPFREKGIPELLNSGNYHEAAMAIDSGPYTSKDVNTGVDIYSSTLEDRRHAEAALFLFSTYVP